MLPYVNLCYITIHYLHLLSSFSIPNQSESVRITSHVNVSELPRASQGGQTPRRCGDGAEEEEAGEAGGGPEQKLRQDMGMWKNVTHVHSIHSIEMHRVII